MALSITGNSSNTLPQSAFVTGAIVNSAVGTNTTVSSKVFSALNAWEEVPGQLRAVITPKAVGNIMVIHAHLAWGGFTRSVDVSALFRVYKSTNSGTSWTICSPVPGVAVGTGAWDPARVHTGSYKYNKGDSNYSMEKDHILIHDIVTSTASTIYAVHWSCGYSTSRTIYWNRPIAGPTYSYNPIHLCTITATEVKV